MSDLYSEWIVKRKKPVWAPFAKGGLLTLTVLCFLLSFTGILWFMVLVGAGLGYLTYRLSLEWDLEYEYTFVKGELDIDKIMGKSRRKRCIVVDLERTEIVAPIQSHALDSFQNNKCKEYDFSSHMPEAKPYVIYATVKNEMARILFEPSERMLNDMRNTAPRKVVLY